MKGVVYFNQSKEFTKEGVLNAGIVWPLFFFVVYVFQCHNPYIALWISFNISCLVCLFHFEHTLSALVWYTGLSIVLLGMSGIPNVVPILLCICISMIYYTIDGYTDEEEKNVNRILSIWPFAVAYVLFTIGIIMSKHYSRFFVFIFLVMEWIVCMCIK